MKKMNDLRKIKRKRSRLENQFHSLTQQTDRNPSRPGIEKANTKTQYSLYIQLAYSLEQNNDLQSCTEIVQFTQPQSHRGVMYSFIMARWKCGDCEKKTLIKSRNISARLRLSPCAKEDLDDGRLYKRKPNFQGIFCRLLYQY